MASFLNAGLSQATQRFISYELGTGDMKKLGEVFSNSLIIHGIIALIVLLISETVGLWFINNCLNIPEERMNAANWVFQFSILSYVVGILSVPYNSVIIAHEHMNVFAYISILEAMFKLLVAFCLLFIVMDKLILFSCLTLCVSIIIRLCYGFYCKRHFSECNSPLSYNKSLMRQIGSFAGWSMLGNLGLIGRDQGANVILNLFLGTSLNAARGIALQVSTLVNQFSLNFTMAMNPQITKQYASGNLEKCSSLVYEGSKFSFFLLSAISIPVIINADYLLQLWLGSVPPFPSLFLILSLVVSLMYCLTQPVTVAIQATRRMKTFQIGISILSFCELPFVWMILAYEQPPYLIMIPQIVSSVIAIFFRFYLLKRYVPYFSWMRYVFNVLLRSMCVISCCLYIAFVIRSYFTDSFMNLTFTTLISIAITCILVYVLGLNSSERIVVNRGINKIVNRFYTK